MTRPPISLLRLGSALLAAGTLGALASLPARGAGDSAGRRSWIVLLREERAGALAAERLAQRFGIRPRQRYRRLLAGFAADLTPAEAVALRRQPDVRGVYPDGPVAIPEARATGGFAGAAAARKRQQIPTGVARCGALASPTAAIDGVDTPIAVGVAVLDTGIDLRHRDLRVVGGVSVQGGRPTDGNGHGTHVAGTIAARDNAKGVVGVAPGAELWAVRVLNRRGAGAWSDVLAGLDWVAQRANRIRVVNMSFGGYLDDDTPLRLAIDRCLAAGIVVVAAAGNDGAPVEYTAPARIPGVIAVSALADSDGRPGASAGLFQARPGYPEADESFANFSNYGPRIDLIAPGVNILSTWKGGGYRTVSGTSQAAPHVAGAAALYLARHPGASPAEVRRALLEGGALFAPSDDPDGIHEPALDVSGL